MTFSGCLQNFLIKCTAARQSNKITYASREGSDQTGHPPSLIRVFAVRMKKYWVDHYPLSAQRRLIRLGGCGCPDWSACSLGALAILLVLSCCGAHEHSGECIDPDQTPPSPALTLFVNVLFHRTLKALYYTYLRFVEAVFLSHLLLNIWLVLIKTELNSRELCPLAWEIWRLD